MKTSRPAEKTSAGIGGVVAALVLLFGLGLDSERVAALVIVLGAVPGIVTWVVEQFRR